METQPKLKTTGLHIRLGAGGRHMATDNINYSVHELWDGDSFIGAAYGGASLMCLGLLADKFADEEAKHEKHVDWSKWVYDSSELDKLSM